MLKSQVSKFGALWHAEDHNPPNEIKSQLGQELELTLHEVTVCSRSELSPTVLPELLSARCGSAYTGSVKARCIQVQNMHNCVSLANHLIT